MQQEKQSSPSVPTALTSASHVTSSSSAISVPTVLSDDGKVPACATLSYDSKGNPKPTVGPHVDEAVPASAESESPLSSGILTQTRATILDSATLPSALAVIPPVPATTTQMLSIPRSPPSSVTMAPASPTIRPQVQLPLSQMPYLHTQRHTPSTSQQQQFTQTHILLSQKPLATKQQLQTQPQVLTQKSLPHELQLATQQTQTKQQIETHQQPIQQLLPTQQPRQSEQVLTSHQMPANLQLQHIQSQHQLQIQPQPHSGVGLVTTCPQFIRPPPPSSASSRGLGTICPPLHPNHSEERRPDPGGAQHVRSSLGSMTRSSPGSHSIEGNLQQTTSRPPESSPSPASIGGSSGIMSRPPLPPPPASLLCSRPPPPYPPPPLHHPASMHHHHYPGHHMQHPPHHTGHHHLVDVPPLYYDDDDDDNEGDYESHLGHQGPPGRRPYNTLRISKWVNPIPFDPDDGKYWVLYNFIYFQ